MVVVYFGWFLFRFEDLSMLGIAIKNLFGGSPAGFADTTAWMSLKNNLGIGIVAALISPVKNLFTSPKAAVKALVGLVLAAAVIGGCYAISSAAPVPNSAGGFFEDAFELKFTDTMMYLTYLVGGVSVLMILVGEIRNAIK